MSVFEGIVEGVYTPQNAGVTDKQSDKQSAKPAAKPAAKPFRVPERLEFVINGLDIAYVNGLRRSILTDVRTAAFAFDPIDPAGQDVKFTHNTGALHNEILGCRVGLLPIHLDRAALAEFDPEDWRFELDVQNEGTHPLDVTSADIRAVRVGRGAPEESRREGGREGRREDADLGEPPAAVLTGGGAEAEAGRRWADYGSEDEGGGAGEVDSDDGGEDRGEDEGGDGGDEGEDGGKSAGEASARGARAATRGARAPSASAFFKPDAITGRHPIVTVLMPPTNGLVQRLSFEARASVDSGSTHCRYCPVSVCALQPVVDEERAAAARNEAADKVRFEFLERPRIARLDPATGRPAAHRFSLETSCGLSAREVVMAGFEALAARLRAAALDLADAERSPAVTSALAPDMAGVELGAQSSTLGAVLQAETMDGVGLEAPLLGFLGYSQRHPLQAVLVLKGLPPGGGGTEPAAAAAAKPRDGFGADELREILRAAAERAALRCERLAEEWARAAGVKDGAGRRRASYAAVSAR